MATDQMELALTLLPEIFLKASPGQALLASICVSASAMASIQQTHHRDADRATKLHEINARSQLTAAALLRSLGTAVRLIALNPQVVRTVVVHVCRRYRVVQSVFGWPVCVLWSVRPYLAALCLLLYAALR